MNGSVIPLRTDRCAALENWADARPFLLEEYSRGSLGMLVHLARMCDITRNSDSPVNVTDLVDSIQGRRDPTAVERRVLCHAAVAYFVRRFAETKRPLAGAI